ncbi:hypothetical protein GCM10010121_005650 [Streptomyces brasiliensis]|uniref:Amidase domain-containing protein n=1 Tax=Streptomyces brasiliensis TaxID=1954 RepID=A0A917K4U0_9ACTN|nr:hypothetical protein GCM10010121_005650 [Streptomyces brasiliensis]
MSLDRAAGLTETARALADGEATSRALVERTLPRIGALLPLNGPATDRAMIAACPYAWPWNVLGRPGVNVPAGFVDGGLPVGAQLLGPANSEALLISLAAQLEARLRRHERWPPGHAVADSPAA